MSDFDIDVQDASRPGAETRPMIAKIVQGSLGIWIVAAALALATIIVAWPGALIGDSIVQLQQIRSGTLNDWHPPLMTVLWRCFGGARPPMLIIQAVIYWSGFGLLASALRRESSVKWGYALLIVGLTPISVIHLGVIEKDTLLTALLVLATGLIASGYAKAGAIPAYLASLCRTNGVFAFSPFVVSKRGLVPTLGLCLVISAALVPVANFINHSIFGAQRAHAEKSLELFDLAGIDVNSGQRKYSFSRCYSPFYWDSLELDCHAFTTTPDTLLSDWAEAIVAHPLAYAKHRLEYFNSTIYFLTPLMAECVYAPMHHEECAGTPSLLKDVVTKNAFVWPVTWLVIGMLMLILPLAPIARMLTVSGLLYGFAYLFVGVATGFRYFYWTELAIQLALVWQWATAGLPRWRIIVVPVAAIWLLGYAFRCLPLVH